MGAPALTAGAGRLPAEQRLARPWHEEARDPERPRAVAGFHDGL